MRLVDRRVPLVEFQLVEPRFQRLHGNVPVLVLRLLGTGDDDPRGMVGDPDGGVGGIDVLTARAG
jgi:hypothetical protein